MSLDVEIQLKQVVRQHLESLSRAGLTHLPRSDGDTLILSESAPSIAVDESDVRKSEVVSTHSPELSPPIVPAEQSPISIPASQMSGQLPVTENPQSSLSPKERQKQLKTLEQSVSQCTRCRELAETRTQTVFGVGNQDAEILFLGEAPGADEDKQGEPFVGRAGKLLNKIIESCQLTREELYICNILKCRPPGNRNPSPEEAGNCREHLDGQIACVDPDYIVCWGSVAAKNLLDSTLAIGKMRGRFYTYGRAKVLCTYHPSYLLRNPSAKKDVWEDLKFLMRDRGIELDAKDS